MSQRIAMWDITSKCNLKCAHCYNQERYWENANKYNDLKEEQINEIIDKLYQLKFTRLHLLGGEPLACNKIIDIIKYAKSKNIMITMVTNGTLLTGKMMLNLYNAGITSISISLDGTTSEDNDLIRGNGVLDTVTNNIKECTSLKHKLNLNILLGISFTLTGLNKNHSNNIVTFANSLGLDGVNISYLSNEGQARNNNSIHHISEEEKFNFIDKIISDYKKQENFKLNIDARNYLAEYIFKKHGIKIDTDNLGCAGADRQFYILADGTLLPCSPSGTSMGECVNKTIFKSINPPNLLKNTVDEIVNSQYLIKFYNYVNNDKIYEDIFPCNNCKYSCTPCPLLYKNNEKIVNECVVAKNKIKSIDEANMLAIYNITPNLRVSKYSDKIEILNFDSQDKYLIENISLKIWNLIDGHRSVKNISEIIYKEFKDKVDKSIIIEDVNNFFYELKKLNFIKPIN